MLVDTATIFVRSGNGGDGVVSFRREKYVPKGGPDGGDGGNGGDVRVVADPETDTLLELAGRHHWSAENGENGAARQKHGADGGDRTIRVPPGTLICDEETGERVADLEAPGDQVVVACGGRGGRGNEHFKRATHQTPREATPGEAGQERRLRLELKLVADVGLVGKPNAGKSTLLARISAARPRIADYPFTTLQPQLGIAELGADRRIVVADIPGLIEGAHQGTGLGLEFLRHVERTRVLLHVIEIEPADLSDPAANYRAINQELARYGSELAERPQVVALNKIDLLPTEADREAALDLIEQAIGVRPLPVSAATGEGVEAVLEACWRRLDKQPEGGWGE